jgi:heptosyltransferase-3
MSVAIEVKKWIDRAALVPLLPVLTVAKRLTTRRPAAPRDEPRRILLVKLWGIGNLAMVLPLCRAIRARHPRAAIEILTLEQNREMVVGCRDLDAVHFFDPRGLPLRGLLALARSLRARRYDLWIDFEQFLRTTALLAFLARPHFAVGFATRRQHRHGVYDRAVALDVVARERGEHMVHGFRALIEAAGIAPPESLACFAPRSRAAARRVAARLATWRSESRPLVVLHPGSGDHFEGRRWPGASFARLADLLVARLKAEVIFTGTAAESAIVARARKRSLAPTADWSGSLSLVELSELLARADLLVSNDTAPVHLAAAHGTPQVALYGPNVPAIYGPLDPRATALTTELGCSPCIVNDNAKTSFCRVPLCMRSLDPVRVFEHAAAQLERRRERCH